jgi:anti-sigma factor RsiW
MRCRDVRYLVIDDAGRDLTPGVSQEVDEHLAQCERCARFRENLGSVRRGVKDLSHPAPSGTVDARVRALIGNAGAVRHGAPEPLPPRWGSFSIPRFIWAAIPVLLVLTTVIMAWGLQDVLDKTGSFLAATFVALLLQNAAMLVLSPLLIRALRRKGSQPTWNHGDAHAS